MPTCAVCQRSARELPFVCALCKAAFEHPMCLIEHRGKAHTPEECAQAPLDGDEAFKNAAKALK
jgi:hypothetical protein